MFGNAIKILCLIFLSVCSIVSAKVEYEIIPLLIDDGSAKGTNFAPTINKNGYVIGTVYDKNKKITPFVYHDDIGFKLIHNLKNGTPKGVNKHGMVVGEHLDAKKPCIFLYDAHTDALTDLKDTFDAAIRLGYVDSDGQFSVVGISDQNVLAINPADSGSSYDAFTYNYDNQEIVNFTFLRPITMNANNQLIGYDSIYGVITRWFYDLYEDVLHNIGGVISSPVAISDFGHVIGHGFGARAYIWSLQEGDREIVISNPSDDHPTNNDPQEIKAIASDHCEFGLTIPVNLPPRYYEVKAVNNNGAVVGRAGTKLQDSRAYIFKSGNGYILGNLGTESCPAGINIDEQVVGWYGERAFVWSDLFSQRAFVWDANNGMRDLTELIPEDSGWTELTIATSISDRGDIVGLGKYKGRTHAFLLKPRMN